MLGSTSMHRPAITLHLDEHNEYCIPTEQNTSAPRGGKKRQITNFTSWMGAWNNYLLTLVHHFPTRARELIGYQYIISNVARKQPFPTVMDYDKKFRTRAATFRTIQWDQRDPELWLECFSVSNQTPQRIPCHHCGSTSHWPQNCPTQSFRGPGLSHTAVLTTISG